MAEKETLVLVDGSSLAFRAFYALMRTGMKTKDGVPSWAIHGFFSSLFDQIERQKPDMIVVCFDLPQPTFRHEKYDLYKANRKEMPDELAVQWPLIKEGVKTFEIPLLEVPGFEADDLIGTLAKKGEAEGYKVIVLTGDRDAFQLVDKEDSSIEIHLTTKEGLVNCGRQEVFERMGVWPEQVIDFKALCGDSSDNIPGVKGIGEKGAQQLLAAYQTLDGVYEHLEEMKSAALKKKLLEGREMAYTSQHLATIHLDVPVDFDFAHAKLTPPREANIRAYFDALNFRQLTSRLGKVLNRFNIELSPEEQLRMPSPLLSESTAPGQLSLFPSLAQAAPIEKRNREFPPPTLIQSEESFQELLGLLGKQEVFAIDLETTGLQALNTKIVGWALAFDEKIGLDEKGRLRVLPRSFADESLKTYYIPVGHNDGSMQLDAQLVIAGLKPLLENQKIGKIAQNGKFEMNVLSRAGINLEPICFDPMLASYIENPDQKHGLKDQALRVFDYQMVRIEELIGSGRKQLTLDMVPLEKVAPYAGDDARLTLELACHYAACFDEEQLFLLHDMELPLQAVLARMEENGVALDTRYLKEFSQELSSQLNTLESEIYELAGHIFNIASTQQLQKVLFDELGLKTKHKTKTGFSTDAAVLEALKDDHPIIAKILDYRQIAKLRSTYVDALPNAILPHDGRLHGEFNQTITSTGRLSSSNPNLQNIPIRTQLGRQIRRAFIAGNPESSLISADYSQIELRLLADMSEDETLLDAFEKNQDIHARTAGEIFDVPLEQVSSDMRRVGKTLNFALVYQQGAYSTAQELGISPREAQQFIDKYFSRYPKIQGFLQNSIAQARANSYAKTLWGRRRYFNHLEDRNDNIRKADERAACNAPIQGSAADLIKLAMISLDKELREAKSGAKLILQVHDELVLEVPDNEMEETKALIDRAMTSGHKLKVPLRVDMGTGKNWMDCK